jgi:hypothetical protein
VPRHRALRSAVDSDRRVPLATVLTAASPALEPSTPGEAEDAVTTMPLSAQPGRGARPRPPRRVRRAAAAPGVVAGAVRGLVVTPWFAAATGFVVAAGLWVYSPHAELSFPSAVGMVPCQARGCGITAGQGGALATTKGHHIGGSGKSAGNAAVQAEGAGRARAARLKFSYVVLWQAGGKFGVRISVTGRHVPPAWKLTFAMPGDQINDVIGADWQSASAGGGTASWPADASGHWQGQAGNVDPSDQGTAANARRHTVSFLVFGQGTPVAPTGCSFNGKSCSFS